MNHSVFHIRLNNFELQAERLLDSSLRTRAVAIISSHHQNGTIVSLSDEAQEEGLYIGMKISLLQKMSHSALLLPYNFTLYSHMHRYIYRIISAYCPIIEPVSYGQYYADMTGTEPMYQNIIQAGYLMSQNLQSKVNLSSNIGISINKLVSRISTAVVPKRIHRIDPGTEQNFLAPLNIPLLPIVREEPVKRIIHFLLLKKIIDIQALIKNVEICRRLFGVFHKQIIMESQGIDTSLVKPLQLKNHIMEQMLLPKDTNDEERLHSTVQTLAEKVGFQLRRMQYIAQNITINIHYTDGFSSRRSGKLNQNDDYTIIQECIRLFNRANTRRNMIRTVIIDASKLCFSVNQLNLFTPIKKNNLALSEALDTIRKKYGFNSIN